MKKMSEARLYQPNLTCRYYTTKTPDNRIRTVIAINKDEGVGITDEQIVEAFWAWTINMLRVLKDKKAKPPREIPSTDVFLTLNDNASVLNLAIASASDSVMLEDTVLAIIVQNWCASMAKEMGIELEIPDDLRGKESEAGLRSEV